MKKIPILFVLFAFTLPGFAQLKYEKESRVKKSNVPANAIHFVDAINFNGKVRWYKEIGFNTITFEAKTKYEGKRYSIEFGEDGSLEDIEIEIEKHEMPSETYQLVSKYLAENHHKYAIEKIQVQYSGDTKLMLEFFRDKRSVIGLVKSYEWVISGKVDNSFTLFEYLFSDNGEFIQKSTITLQNTDNMVY